MKALVLTDKFAPHAGGTAVVWTEWCNRWPADRVRVVTRQFEGWEAFDRQQPYAISRVPFVNIPRVRMPLVWGRILLRALRECRRDPVQLVHCAQILETGLYAPWLSRRFGVPYFVHTYGEELAAYGRRPRLRDMLRRVLVQAAGVTTISRYTEGLLRELFAYQGPVLLVPPGVDGKRFMPGRDLSLRTRWQPSPGPLLVTVARFMPRKGYDRMLQALPEICRRFPDAQYVMVGAGPDEGRLRQMVSDLGLADRVRLPGKIPPADLVALLQAADVFVHPNREMPNGDVEGFGIVFLEAGACGLPVVGGRSGGTIEAVDDGVTGFLVDPESPAEIAQRVLQLLEDPALRQRMGDSGREHALRFSWDAAASRVWDWSTDLARCRT